MSRHWYIRVAPPFPRVLCPFRHGWENELGVGRNPGWGLPTMPDYGVHLEQVKFVRLAYMFITIILLQRIMSRSVFTYLYDIEDSAMCCRCLDSTFACICTCVNIFFFSYIHTCACSSIRLLIRNKPPIYRVHF